MAKEILTEEERKLIREDVKYFACDIIKAGRKQALLPSFFDTATNAQKLVWRKQILILLDEIDNFIENFKY